MPDIVRRKKAMSVNPLKASQPVGGSLATLGFDRAMPMLHGSQGCTAFAKVYFVRHFREPIPLQSTAMDQSSSIMGADDNVIEGLKTVAEKSKPDLITVLTTGLSETQGTDVKRCVKEFRARYPQFGQVAVVAVNTPDFVGCLESGYAATVAEILTELVPESKQAGSRKRQVNILAGSMLTPGDLEHLRDIVEWFGLRPVFVPDLSDSLDGHLTDSEFSPVTVGGTTLSDLQTLGEASATLAVGTSLKKAADMLEQRTGVPCHRFDHLYGLRATDALVMALANISGERVPGRLERQRAQLQDAMVDTHFMMGFLRVAVAADPDQLNALAHLIREMGGETVAAVAAGDGPALEHVPVASVKVGDLEDLEQMARDAGAEIIIGNSHAVQTAEHLNLPILRCGFPLYDQVGGYQKTFIGYAGARQTLFDLSNLTLSNNHRHEVPVYRSMYGQKPASESFTQPLQATADGAHPTHAHC
ncbi:MAG: nitrogenase iron-molybdenum cofactor biosynthesis protein NifN [Methylotetracoccus sp.]|nr:nitrogenase iron-molybdenum cofactor biosynthesis protein NifN [Methylotetracoccus sp.]